MKWNLRRNGGVNKGLYVTATGVESGRNVGFAGVIGDFGEGNNNNLA